MLWTPSDWPERSGVVRKVQMLFVWILSDKWKSDPSALSSPFWKGAHLGVIKTGWSWCLSYCCTAHSSTGARLCISSNYWNLWWKQDKDVIIKKTHTHIKEEEKERERLCCKSGFRCRRAFPLHLHLGLAEGAEVPAALPLPQPVEMNCSLGVDKSPWCTIVAMETMQTQQFWGKQVKRSWLHISKSSAAGFSWPVETANTEARPLC